MRRAGAPLATMAQTLLPSALVLPTHRLPCPRGHSAFETKRFVPRRKALANWYYCPVCSRFFSRARIFRAEQRRIRQIYVRKHRLEWRTRFDPYRLRDCPIYVKSLTGKTVQLFVDLALDTSFDVQVLLERHERSRLMDGYFIFAGKRLDPDQPLGGYRILRDSTLHLVLRMRAD